MDSEPQHSYITYICNMKKFLLSCCFVLTALFSFADQLEYVSKESAIAAAEAIQKARVVYAYCGCCDYEKPIKLKVEKIIVRPTGYEDYYQVYVVVDGTEIPLDLAYAWVKVEKSWKTVGEVVALEHDPCERIRK